MCSYIENRVVVFTVEYMDCVACTQGDDSTCRQLLARRPSHGREARHTAGSTNCSHGSSCIVAKIEIGVRLNSLSFSKYARTFDGFSENASRSRLA